MAYVQSDKVNKAEKDYYSYLNGNKPGEFSSEYTAKAKDALAAYENRGEFNYNPATDTGYQAARKQYTAGGKQAMKDTLGTATELTGGYDNSYAQVAAQQTYNNYMAELANLMPQYEQQAYGRWQDQGQQMLDYYSLMKGAETDAYAKYRDTVSDYYTNADRLYGLYMDAYNTDYGMYRDNVEDQQYADEMAYRQKQDAIANGQWERNFAHGVAMDNAAAETAYLDAQSDYLNALNEEELAAAGYDYAGIAYETDANGKKIEVGRRFIKDGKEYVFDTGTNPNNGKVNGDVLAGANTWNNGYIPSQIGIRDKNGKVIEWKDLRATSYSSDDNGTMQTIFTTGDGHYWLWNDDLNKYEEVENPTPNITDRIFGFIKNAMN